MLNHTFICFFGARILNATASFTKRIIKNPSHAEVSMPLTSTRPSDAPPEQGNKIKRHVRDGEGWVITRSKRFIKKEEQGSRRVKAEGDEFRAERRRPYGRPVGRRAVGLVSANLSLGPRLTTKSSRTPFLNPARRTEERRCCGSEGQVCQMSTFSSPATVVTNAHGYHGTRRGGGWLVVGRSGAGGRHRKQHARRGNRRATDPGKQAGTQGGWHISQLQRNDVQQHRLQLLLRLFVCVDDYVMKWNLKMKGAKSEFQTLIFLLEPLRTGLSKWLIFLFNENAAFFSEWKWILTITKL